MAAAVPGAAGRSVPSPRERPGVATSPSDDGAGARRWSAQWRAAGGTGRPRIAIVDWAEVKTRPDQEILREAFAARGFDCVLADPREMDVAGGRLHAAGAPVDLVYRRAVLSELVAREDEVRAFLGAYRRRPLPVRQLLPLPALRGQGLLRHPDRRGVRPPAERGRAGAAWPRVLPWTRRVAERHTLEGRARGRPRAVRRSRTGSGWSSSRPTTTGAARSSSARRPPPGEWEAAVRAALDAPWVVQERVEIPEEPFPVFDERRARRS